jgi:hypothetical protein
VLLALVIFQIGSRFYAQAGPVFDPHIHASQVVGMISVCHYTQIFY